MKKLKNYCAGFDIEARSLVWTWGGGGVNKCLTLQ